MKQNLSFKDYYESINTLKDADENTPRMETIYECRKYCKVPLNVDDDDKKYIPLKPKDRVIIEWEYHTLDKPCPKMVVIESSENDVSGMFSWNDVKVRKWVDTTLVEVQ